MTQPTTPADFGSCWSCITDLTMPSVMASGFRVVAEAIARRWYTPRGGLIDDPDYGYDLTDFLNADISKSELAQIAANAGREAEKDERVLSCDCVVEFLGTGELRVSGSVTTAQGPFQLVVSVTQVTVALLQVSP